MTIREFGNAFKALINRDGTPAQKTAIDNNTVANFYVAPADPAYHNYVVGNSAIIDAFFNDDGAGNSRFPNNVRAVGAASTLNYTIGAADINNIPGVRQVTNLLADWRAPVAGAGDATDVVGHGGNAGNQGRIDDALAGYIFARIYLNGWTANEIDVTDTGGGAIQDIKIAKAFAFGQGKIQGITNIFAATKIATWRAAVRADANYGATIGALPAGKQNFVIDQYFNKNLTPADVTAAYAQGWVFGAEIRRGAAPGNAPEISLDNGANWVGFNWAANGRGARVVAAQPNPAGGNLTADDVAKINAYQTADGTAAEIWNPALTVGEQGQITAAPNAGAVPGIIAGIQQARFQAAVRADANYGATIGALPAGKQNFVIDQYFNKNLTPADVTAAYAQGWVFGAEIRRGAAPGNAPEISLDNGANWVGFNWAANGRGARVVAAQPNPAGGNLTADDVAKINAYQTADGTAAEIWNPALTVGEQGQITAAPNAGAVPGIIAGIQQARFQAAVRADANYGATIGALPAGKQNFVIDQYFNKNLTPADVTAAYAQGWVFGAEIRRGAAPGNAPEISLDNGANWVGFNWAANGRGARVVAAQPNPAGGNLTADDVAKINAYQTADGTAAEIWNPALTVGEQGQITAAPNAGAVPGIIAGIQQARFQAAVRADANYGATIGALPAGKQNFVIDQYFNKNLTPADVTAAYAQGWVFGAEIRRGAAPGNAPEISLDNGANWVGFNWAANGRGARVVAAQPNPAGGNLTADDVAKINAYQTADGTAAEIWNPALTVGEQGQITAAPNAGAVPGIIAGIQQARFQAAVRADANYGATIGALPAGKQNFVIDQYFNKNLTPADVTAAYAQGWVFGAEIRRGAAPGNAPEISLDNGANWVGFNWAANGRGARVVAAQPNPAGGNLTADDVAKINAYQTADGTAAEIWNPALTVGEQGQITAAPNAGAVPGIIAGIQQARFQAAVRADANYGATIGALPAGKQNFVIDQYFNKNLTPADVTAAYAQGWVFGAEIRRGAAPGNAPEISLDNGANWVGFNWAANGRGARVVAAQPNPAGGNLTADDVAKINAYQTADGTAAEIWNPALTVGEQGQITAAPNAGAVPGIIAGIQQARFQAAVRADANYGATIGALPAGKQNFVIDQYFNKNLTPADVTAAYAQGWVFGAEIRRGAAPGNAPEISLDNGANWVGFNWAANGRGARVVAAQPNPAGGNLTADDVAKINAYQTADGTAAEIWNPALTVGEQGQITAAPNAGAVPGIIAGIQQARFQAAVRADANYGATIGALPAGKQNFVIDQYFNKNLTPADVTAAYAQGWVFGAEIRRGAAPGNAPEISLDNGANWVGFNWAANGRGARVVAAQPNPAGGNLTADDVAKINAYQTADGTAAEIWNPALTVGEQGQITAAPNAGAVPGIIAGIQNTRRNAADTAFINAFKATANPANAYDAMTNPQILAYRKSAGTHTTTGVQGATARNGSWEAAEIQVLNTGARQISIDSGASWHEFDWTDAANTKAVWNQRVNFISQFRAVGGAAANAVTINDVGVSNYQKRSPDGSKLLTGTQAGTAYNKGWVNNAEIQITDAGVLQVNTGAGWWNVDPTVTSRTKAQFVHDFKAVDASLANTPDATVLEYDDKNLTAVQAAALYNGSPRVPGSDLSKGTGADAAKVVYNGTAYEKAATETDAQFTAKIIAAKQAKDAADAAARLATAKTTAETAIQAKLDETPDNKAKITDVEVKTKFNELNANAKIANDKTWKEHLNGLSSESAVTDFQTKMEAAITEIRKAQTPPFDAAAARTAAISAVKDHWKTNSSDKTETGTVNSKTITGVLGDNWESEFDNLTEQSTIDTKKTELIGKIDTEKGQEQPTDDKATDEGVKKGLKEITEDAEPTAEVVVSWKGFEGSLKTDAQIESFLKEEIKGHEEEFAAVFDELPADEKPTGDDKKEQVKNFVANQKAEVVVKAVFRYKLKDDSIKNKTQTDMENEKDDEDKPLDEQKYPKQDDGKYTPEAMIKYMFEKKTGKPFEYAIKKQQPAPSKEPSHWDKNWGWYVGGFGLAALVGLGALLWSSWKDTEGEEENK